MLKLSVTGVVVIALCQMVVCYVMYSLGKAIYKGRLDTLVKLFAAYVLSSSVEEEDMKKKIKELEGDKQ